MEIGIFIPSGSQFDNEIPAPHQRKGSVFWSFLQPVVGLQPEHEPWHNEGVSREIAEIRAYEARRVEANNSLPPQVTLADLASEAVTHLVDAVKAKVRKPTELQRAKTWLQDTLSGGPMLATAVEKLAIKAGISKRTLRRAAKSAKVQSRRKGRGPWVWTPLQAEGQT
jgi:hypothetical protein